MFLELIMTLLNSFFLNKNFTNKIQVCLVFNLSNISCFKKAQGEARIDAKMISYGEINGELKVSPKTTKFCTYKLILCQKKRNCILTVDLEIKTNLNIYLCKFISGRLVKCTENIGIYL
ncbi:hypothetical protein CDIK_3524 [Cucumispora dikerogammari]|nr:hypothetical protein CDIK_3524 [Cucumispora dikerogammari]